jgi:hypothetical protein
MHNVRKTAQFFSIAVTLTVAFVFLSPQPVLAFPNWVSDFADRYPGATNLGDCGTCHNSFTSAGQGENPYGEAVANQAGAIDARLAAIEGDDSDGDGETNLTEIMTGSGFEPGWDCDSYEGATNAPANLADFVDINDIGCVGVTTTVPTTTTMGATTTTMGATTTTMGVTTTMGATTTTMGATTTTMGATTTSSTTSTTVVTANCAQPVSGGPMPTATDCLFILNAAVRVTTCSPECICAPSGTLPISATDALICLNKSVGVDVPLNCPC